MSFVLNCFYSLIRGLTVLMEIMNRKSNPIVYTIFAGAHVMTRYQEYVRLCGGINFLYGLFQYRLNSLIKWKTKTQPSTRTRNFSYRVLFQSASGYDEPECERLRLI